MDAAPHTEHAATALAPSRISRFRPDDPKQMVYRSMLAELDEDQILCLESDIDQYQSAGVVSRRLAELLNAA